MTDLTDSSHKVPEIDPAPLPVRYSEAGLRIKAERARKADERKQADTGPAPTAAAPYPVEALGKVLGDFVKGAKHEIGCPVEIPANSALAVVSLIAQDVANIVLPKDGVTPGSIYALTIALPGQGKTMADKLAMNPVKALEERLRKQCDKDKLKYDRDVATWVAQHNQITRAKSDRAKKDELLKELGPKPDRPETPKMTTSEGTSEGIMAALAKRRRGLGIFSDEGSQFLSGHAFGPEKKRATCALLSTNWGGGTTRKDTVGHGEIEVRDKRLALHLMVQPTGGKEALIDPILNESGLLSRCLVAWPKPNIGYREDEDEETPKWAADAFAKYERQMRFLFDAVQRDDFGAVQRRDVELSPEARKEWFEFRREVEDEQAKGGRYECLKEIGTAVRAPQHAGRIALILALIEDHKAAAISGDVIRRSITLARWYLDERLRLLETASVADEVHYAEVLIEWAVQRVKGREPRYFTLNELNKFGPRHLRPQKLADGRPDTSRRDSALNSLIRDARLYVVGSSALAWQRRTPGVKIEFNVPVVQ
jgi:Protein of unknown function (DUF3987)